MTTKFVSKTRHVLFHVTIFDILVIEMKLPNNHLTYKAVKKFLLFRSTFESNNVCICNLADFSN